MQRLGLIRLQIWLRLQCNNVYYDPFQPFYKRLFGKTKEEELEEFKLNEEQEAKIQFQEQIELEEKAVQLRRQRNKSRYSG